MTENVLLGVKFDILCENVLLLVLYSNIYAYSCIKYLKVYFCLYRYTAGMCIEVLLIENVFSE